MYYDKQASPASSTSTVDQQEIIFDDNVPIQDNSKLPKVIINQLPPHQQPTPQPRAQARAQQQPKQPRAKPQKSQQPRQIRGAHTNNTSSSSATTTNANPNATTTSAATNKCSPPKRLRLYHHPQKLAPWKSLQHHFLRHGDVKYRPEKRMTMAELGHEVLQRRNGWKVHHLVGQLTDLIQNESQTRDKINNLLELFTCHGAKRVHDLAKNSHKLPEQYEAILKSQRSYGRNEFEPELIVTKLDDLLKGDMQRSNMFDDQLRDCRDLVVRLTNEHRDRVSRISTKFNKRLQL